MVEESENEAAELLAPTRIHRLTAVIASHGDEDHIAGLTTVLRTTAVDALLLPSWMLESHEAVPLIRTARRRDVRVIPVARGSRLVFGDAVIEVLWPPGQDPPADENERSLVARLILDQGTVLLTADIGNAVERRLAVTTDLRCTTVIVPHHGSRHSASPEFLDATDSPRSPSSQPVRRTSTITRTPKSSNASMNGESTTGCRSETDGAESVGKRASGGCIRNTRSSNECE